MLANNIGYNVSPESTFKLWDKIGKDGTFVTDKKAILDAIGEFTPGAGGKGTGQ